MLAGNKAEHYLPTLHRQTVAVGCPGMVHDLRQCDAVSGVLAQHLRNEILEVAGHHRSAWEADVLCADDIVQTHDAWMLEGHCACKTIYMSSVHQNVIAKRCS